MPDRHLSEAGAAVGRTAAKVFRRLLGLVLLTVAIGLSTCHALDGVRDAATGGEITSEVRS